MPFINIYISYEDYKYLGEGVIRQTKTEGEVLESLLRYDEDMPLPSTKVINFSFEDRK